MLGQIIQNYKIVKNIGDGGMGDVYLAKHLRLDKKVAIKILNIDPKKNKDLLTRFEIEAKTLNKLKHKHIVELFDYDEINGIPYIIMEYVDGTPLDSYIEKKSGPIPEEKTVKYMLQILEALGVAHNAGIIHRDVKPSNFILDKNDNIKVLDFGIAKMASETDDYNLTKMGQGLGTLPYMSPEQVLGKEMYSTTDIYSLGVNLHQMITAKEPFSQKLTRRQIEDKIIAEPLERIKSIYPHASERIQAIIDKATQKEPDNRFQSCKEFADALIDSETMNIPVDIPADTPVKDDINKTIVTPKPSESQKTATKEENNYTKTVVSPPKTQEEPKKSNNLMKILGVVAVIMLTFAGYLFFNKAEYKVKIVENDTTVFEKNYKDSTEAIKIGKKELAKFESKSELTVKTEDELVFRKIKEELIAENDEIIIDEEAEATEEIAEEADESVTEKPVTPREKPVVKTKIQTFTASSFQDNFNIIANTSYDYTSRQAHLTKFLKKFTSDAAVFVYQNGEKVGTEAIKDYLESLLFTGKKVNVSITAKKGKLIRDIEVTEN